VDRDQKDDKQRFTEIRELSRRGLDVQKNEPPGVRRRLMEEHDLFAFVEREYPLLIDKWQR